jgi:guanylate kinase
MEESRQPRLKHYQEFKEILGNYKISPRAQKATKNLKLVLLLAPTSSGKNTIIRYQLATGRYYFIVSDTTRPPRINDGVMEKSGREYWFRSEPEMLADLRAGELLEAEIIHKQQVSGISIRELEKAQKQGKIAITDVDRIGVRNIIKAKSDTIVVMLIPPSFQEWQKRLALRGKMTPEEQKRRFETALRVFQVGLDNNYNFVIAENVEKSAEIIDVIIEGHPNPHQDRGKKLIKELQKALKNKLTSMA